MILGANVVVNWMKRGVRLSLAEGKIKRWSLDILMALETMVLTPAMADKLIGKPGSTAGLSVGKIGRAYLHQSFVGTM